MRLIEKEVRDKVTQDKKNDSGQGNNAFEQVAALIRDILADFLNQFLAEYS